MARKLDKFQGRINFKTDSPDKIQKTLNELRDYLNKYQEDEAAKIIENFSQTNNKPQQDKIKEEKILKEIEDRNKILKQINKNLGKIHEDLIDEQKTKIHSGKANWTNKTKATKGIKTPNTKEADKLKKNPLQWLKDALFGSLLGTLISRLLSPLKWLLKGLFAIGGLGFKLVKTLVSSLAKGLFAAGAAGAKAIGKGLDKFYQSKIKPQMDKLKTSVSSKVDDLKKSVKGEKKPKAKVDGMQNSANRAWDKVGSFFSSAKNQVKQKGISAWNSTKQGANKAFQAATTTASKAAKYASNAASNISKQAKAQWESLKNKVKSIGEKLIGHFKKASGKGGSKAATKLATRMPKALGKFASKFIPGVGLALLAWDVYAAAKKSNSVVSFAVNLIDEISGGLIGMGLSAALEDFDGENLGEYVDNLIKGSLNLTGEELNILDGIDMQKMEANSQEVLKIINDIGNLKMDGDSHEIEKIEGSLQSNPHKKAIVDEYKKLSTMAASGTISQNEANKRFKEFIQKTLSADAAVKAVKTDPQTGVELDEYGNPVESTPEGIKNPDVNIAAHDAAGAMQVKSSLLTMQASANFALQAAQQAAQSVSHSNPVINIAQGGGQQPIIQG